MIKQIDRIAPPPATHWVGDGFKVSNFIPQVFDMPSMDPFILLDYDAKRMVAPTNTPGGVEAHPHRGFETVTVVFKGRVAHHDSRGNSGVIGDGDVQWMTAASGVLHTEYHEAEWAKQGGEYHVAQLWVNLPAKDKMGEPAYQAIVHSQRGVHPLADGSGVVEVIAGEYQGARGPAKTHSPMHLMELRFERAGRAEFSFPEQYNTALLAVEGEALINGEAKLPTDHLLRFANEGENFSVESLGAGTFLLMSGEPLREPIVPYGPFVMNTRSEIIQAIEDFNQGKFGEMD